MANRTILVVDDEADVRAFLTAVLHKHGYETRTATDGLQALEIIRRRLSNPERPEVLRVPFYREQY